MGTGSATEANISENAVRGGGHQDIPGWADNIGLTVQRKWCDKKGPGVEEEGKKKYCRNEGKGQPLWSWKRGSGNWLS